MKKIVSLTLAAALAVSSSVVCFAEGADSDMLKTELSIAKGRIAIPAELSKFSYDVDTEFNHDVYSFRWATKDSEDYKRIECSIYKSVITYYSIYDQSDYQNPMSQGKKLAALSADQLYTKAVNALKTLNPTVCTDISIDKDSLNISLSGNNARFALTRTKNGIPVASDRGYITVDKNTGALLGFSINWHPGASFKDPSGAISESTAKSKYAAMIDLQPQYEIYYDEDSDSYKTQLTYVQSDYGEINAFTGNKSSFEADAYYGDDDMGNPETGDASMDDSAADVTFTPEEQAEIDKKLPYGNEQAVRKLISDNKYLWLDTDMKLAGSNLSRIEFAGDVTYYYEADFRNDITTSDSYFNWSENSKETTITLNAETGEVISFYHWSASDSDVTAYDMQKASALAGKIAKNLAPTHIAEYTNVTENANSYTNSGVTKYSGSSHNFGRVVNSINVSGNDISVRLDQNYKLKSYRIDYNDVEFVSPKNILTAKQVMDKFWESHSIELSYLARLEKTKTATVLVYQTSDIVYADAFTGEQMYPSYYAGENDLSGIKDTDILKKAQALDDHNILISTDRFSENDAVKLSDLRSVYGVMFGYNYWWDDYNIYTEVYDEDCTTGSSSSVSATADVKVNLLDKTITRGAAMIEYVTQRYGSDVAKLSGIYKSPFTDVSEGDANLGYYAIAYAAGAISGTTLNADADYTYGELINLVYSYLK